MIPNRSKITINDNENLIRQFLEEVVIYQKQTLNKWAVITAQTPAAKIGYVGQHLASLITGVQGTRSGARGDDMADGTEVKSCNKIDQADKCKDCKGRVLRTQTVCPNCGSTRIERKEDSKWLFSVRDEEELNQYLNLDRVFLLLMDYPNFHQEDFRDIRISAFEIYPKEKRMHVFRELISNHYYNIYRPKADAGNKTNPMNLHPFSIQFFKCNPIKTFECIIHNIDTHPAIEISTFIPPSEERSENLSSVDLPSNLLKADEWNILLQSVDFEADILPSLRMPMTKNDFQRLGIKDKMQYLPFLNEHLKELIPLREIRSITQREHYHRQ